MSLVDFYTKNLALFYNVSTIRNMMIIKDIRLHGDLSEWYDDYLNLKAKSCAPEHAEEECDKVKIASKDSKTNLIESHDGYIKEALRVLFTDQGNRDSDGGMVRTIMGWVSNMGKALTFDVKAEQEKRRLKNILKLLTYNELEKILQELKQNNVAAAAVAPAGGGAAGGGAATSV
tara:strand:- start:349 stop:873 length:525 start_codon:yes stop_codon:yes gene_type:complete